MNFVSRIKRFLYKLRNTPLHPQWLLYKDEERTKRLIANRLSGDVLDIGSGRSEFATLLENKKGLSYYCLDYPDTASWYRTMPHIFADGQQLPIRSGSIDNILLLQVLEHIPRPDECMSEIFRALKKGGHCYIALPFLYPVHDSPNDFQRWTNHGLTQLFKRHGFRIEYIEPLGRSMETAGLLINIALAILVRDAISKRSPAALIAIISPIIFLMNNIFFWILSLFSSTGTMPHGYSILLSKSTD